MMILAFGLLFAPGGCDGCLESCNPPPPPPFVTNDESSFNGWGFIANYYNDTIRVAINFPVLNELDKKDKTRIVINQDTLDCKVTGKTRETIFSTTSLTIGDNSGDRATLVYRGGMEWNEHGVLIGDVSYGQNLYELRKTTTENYILGKVSPSALLQHDSNDSGTSGTPGTSLPPNNCQVSTGNAVS